MLTEPLGVITGATKVGFPLSFTFRTNRTRLFAIAMISLSLWNLGGEESCLSPSAKTRQTSVKASFGDCGSCRL